MSWNSILFRKWQLFGFWYLPLFWSLVWPWMQQRYSKLLFIIIIINNTCINYLLIVVIENVPIVTNVTVGNPGVTIIPSSPSRTMFTVLLQQIQEMDENGKEVYSIVKLGTNFTLRVINFSIIKWIIINHFTRSSIIHRTSNGCLITLWIIMQSLLLPYLFIVIIISLLLLRWQKKKRFVNLRIHQHPSLLQTRQHITLKIQSKFKWKSKSGHSVHSVIISSSFLEPKQVERVIIIMWKGVRIMWLLRTLMGTWIGFRYSLTT